MEQERLLLLAQRLQGQVHKLTDKYFDKIGKTINLKSMTIPKAIKIAQLIESEIVPFIKLIEIKRCDDQEIVIFDMELEISQLRSNNVKNIERVAISFNNLDTSLPMVELLRIDFPLVPHLEWSPKDSPKRICLYNKSYEEIKHTLNGAKILSQIRYWLEATARGDLHDLDQPLEQIMYSSNYTLFLPRNFLNYNKLPLFKIKQFKNRILLLPYAKSDFTSNNISNTLFYLPILINVKPQIHGYINDIPQNLEELKLICEKFDVNLIDRMRKIIKSVMTNYLNKNKIIFKFKLLIIMYIPKKRAQNKMPESYEIHSFVTNSSIEELGKSLDVIQKVDNLNGMIIGDKFNIADLKTISVLHLNTSFLLSKQYAAFYNNECFELNPDISLIGVGALGSQICMNLVRSGFGKFNLIDDDCFLPHNAARHVLTSNSIGDSKVNAICKLANSITYEENTCKSLPYNVLKDKNKVSAIISSSDTILDISTSIAVERYIGIDIDGKGRRISIFLNPSGKALVMLIEDSERKSRIDWLEMQYYRYIINRQELSNHISDFPGDIRYSNSCRDITSRIPNDFVSIHAATASRIIKAIHKNTEANIIISELSTTSYNVITNEYPTYDLINYNVDDWCICTDKSFIAMMKQRRKEKLPNETGGIILGSFDFERKIIYLVDILSPKDSLEYPTSYVRGCSNLKEELEEISFNTAGNIEYVGEWHSHPDGYGTVMSYDDEKLLSYLHEQRLSGGYPGIVVIVGDANQNIGIYIS